MKTKILFLLFAATMMLFSCQKDEPEQEVKEDPVAFAQTYTGQPFAIYWDGSGVLANSHVNHTTQNVINLRFIDSIRYNIDYQADFVDYYGDLTIHSTITWYSQGQIYKRARANTKWRGMWNYTQIPLASQGFNSDIKEIISVRDNLQTEPYFDNECLKDKLAYVYENSYVYQDTTVTKTGFLKSNSCNRNYILFPRNFRN